MNVFANEAISSILCSVVNQKVAVIQILVVRKNQTFVRTPAEVSLNPNQFVRPR